MKRTWTIFIGLVLLASCNNKGQENDINNFAWYDSVFSKAEYDTTTVVPDYAFSTDWMQRYVQYIKENFENRGGDIWFSNDTAEGFDCRYWTLAYVDGDTIPELYLWGGCWASGAIILTQSGDKVYASPRGYYTYIKGADGLLHSQWKHGDDVWGAVYEMRNGKFTEIASYTCNTDMVDTSEVSNYGLTLDSLKCHYAGGEIGNSEVYISEIELNGKRLGACFGYNQYVSCTGFVQVKQTLDALYYSKGTNTYFPIIFNTSRKPIDELISKIK